MGRIYLYMLILAALVVIDLIVFTNYNGTTTTATNVNIGMIILVIALCSPMLFALRYAYPVFELHRHLRSAEFELMEKYARWRNSDGGANKVRGNLELFEELTKPTIKINDQKIQSAMIGITHPPVHIFEKQADAVYQSRIAETDKASTRKNAVRLNASILRLVLFGSREVAQQKVQSLKASDREQLTTSLAILAESRQLTTSVNLMLVKMIWQHPVNLTFDSSGTILTGQAALERMATL